MAAGTLVVKDASNVSQSLSVSQDPTNSNALVGTTSITDPATGYKATISLLHTTDNQAPGGSAYGFFNSGVELLVNAAGNLDRARGAPGTVGVQAVSSDGTKATYRYAMPDFTPVATPTDILVIQGSATKTIRIKRIAVYGESTAAGSMGVQLVRRSTAGTLGSAVLTAVTAGKHDTGDGAATAVISTVGTANYTTLGTSAGVMGAALLTFGNAGAVQSGVVWDYSTRNDKAIILRGATDFLCINMNGDAVPTGGKVYFDIETEEDNS
ncbi:MAG: hypothetical protein ACXWAT_00855 [Methylobacter sp.]